MTTFLKQLIDLRDNGPSNPYEGICNNIDIHEGDEGYEEYVEIMRAWPMFTGNSVFPVPHPTIDEPNRAYMETDNVWEGDYGDNRRAFLDYLIEELSKETRHDTA